LLKIAYIHQYFGTTKGSWSTRPYEFGKRWSQAGYQVTIITAPYYKSDVVSSRFIDRQYMDRMEVIIINAPDSNLFSKLKRIWNALRFAFSCTWLVIRCRYDVVIASSGPITVGIPGIAAKLLRKSKLIFEVRDLWPEGGVQMGLFKGRFRNKLAYWFESFCYKQSDAIIALSQGMEEYIKMKNSKLFVTVIPNSSDTDLFQNKVYAAPDFPQHLLGKRLFVYFGSLGLMDACEEILYGFQLLKHRTDLGCVFIGDGAYRKDLEGIAKEIGLSDHVHFTGLIPKSDVVGWLKEAVGSFVVFKPFPVLSTSSPNKLFDSFASGLPVIQNTKGWMSELIDRTGCGINVVSGDSVSMSNAILKLADDPEFWSKASSSSLQLGSIEFNRSFLSDKYIGVINSISHV
jgi:glycosyltransferase involved in cell wall biosynthesis